MKLEKFKEKKKIKASVIVLGCLTLISIGFLLHRTLANFQTNDTFKMMEGNLDYFGGSDIFFAFYQNEIAVDTMPSKESDLAFKTAECTNNASVVWNKETWEPTIRNLTKTKTKCTLYFETPKTASEKIMELAKSDTSNLLHDETVDNNLRYIGPDPKNYVSFNNEIWRIIGVMNNIDDGTGKKESRIKLIRNESVANIEWDTSNISDWSTSSLQTNLNNGTWEKWHLNEESQSFVHNAVWNLGGVQTYTTSSNGLATHWYSYEHGTTVYDRHASRWTGKVGLISPSDYGYATGATSRTTCLTTELFRWNDKEDCYKNDWLYQRDNNQWTITPYAMINDAVYMITNTGYVGYYNVSLHAYAVRPSVYLKATAKIKDGDGSLENPFILER